MTVHDKELHLPLYLCIDIYGLHIATTKLYIISFKIKTTEICKLKDCNRTAYYGKPLNTLLRYTYL